MCPEPAAAAHLEVRLLGELEVTAQGVKLALPQSRKTRALLGYLLLTGHAHRRERLCSLLWDVADDPRAALRWSLSKLRELVDTQALKRLVSDREHVSVSTTGMYVDALELPRLLGSNVQSAAPQALSAAHALFRGELLEGLELADLHGFSAWLLAERARFRELHRRVLTLSIEHSGGHPQRVLPLIRELVQIDPTDAAARARLLEVLHATGAIGEAHEQARADQRLLATSPVEPPAAAGVQAASATRTAQPTPPEPRAPQLVGRDAELAALQAWLDQAQAGLKAWMIEGEAGMGKSRLLHEYEQLAGRAGARTVRVRVPEVRPGWPYAALQGLLAQLERGGQGPLEQLLEASQAPTPVLATGSREALLLAVQAVLERAVPADAPLVLLLDDVHYLDDASIELMQLCALGLRAKRIGIVLTARGGELHDRPSVTRTLRALSREQLLQELHLAPLTFEQAQPMLVGPHAQQLFEWSGGNPLFLTLLRAEAPGALPRSIARLVQDRVASLPAEQADLLRWAAVLGAVFRTDPLRQLVGLDDEPFVEALEGLARHGWLSLSAELEGHARFEHQVAQRALYDQLSEPRKRLMHHKVAQLLTRNPQPPSAHGATLEHTALLAHHAVAAGDRALAVRACMLAAQRCIRVYAHADAFCLARRGLVQAQHLPEPEQTCLSLELYQLQLHARWPDSPDEVSCELEQLTQRALDLGAVGHAHMGFHLRAYLKWHAGDCADAQRYSREVERISRLAGRRERADALSYAARCLAQLERDLSDAQAFVHEAELLAEAADPPPTLPLARGILTVFRGDNDLAATELEHARQLAARAGNRLEEFYALEFCVYLELARERYAAALQLCAELSTTAERLREGSELAFARAAHALVRVLAGTDPDLAAFDRAYAELALQDAKQRCAFLSAEAAHFLGQRGDWTLALSRAQRALTLARAVDRPTESALALCVIVRAELTTGSSQLQEHLSALRACLDKPVSAHARSRAQAALALAPPDMAASEQERAHGDRHRRARVRGTRPG